MYLIQCISWPSNADLEIKTERSVLSVRFCVLLFPGFGVGRESAQGTRLVGSGAGGEGYIRIMLVLGLERDDVIISLFAGYNIICYLGSSSTFNFVSFSWREQCNRFDWLNVDLTHLTDLTVQRKILVAQLAA